MDQALAGDSRALPQFRGRAPAGREGRLARTSARGEIACRLARRCRAGEAARGCAGQGLQGRTAADGRLPGAVARYPGAAGSRPRQLLGDRQPAGRLRREGQCRVGRARVGKQARPGHERLESADGPAAHRPCRRYRVGRTARQRERADVRAAAGASAPVRSRKDGHDRPRRPLRATGRAGPRGRAPREGEPRWPRRDGRQRARAHLAAAAAGGPQHDRDHDRPRHPSPRPDRLLQGNSLPCRSREGGICRARRPAGEGGASRCEWPRGGAGRAQDEYQRLVPRHVCNCDGGAARAVDDPRRGAGRGGRRKRTGRGIQAAQVPGETRRRHGRGRARSPGNAHWHGHHVYGPARHRREGSLPGRARDAVSDLVPLVLSGAAVRRWRGKDRPRDGRDRCQWRVHRDVSGQARPHRAAGIGAGVHLRGHGGRDRRGGRDAERRAARVGRLCGAGGDALCREVAGSRHEGRARGGGDHARHAFARWRAPSGHRHAETVQAGPAGGGRAGRRIRIGTTAGAAAAAAGQGTARADRSPTAAASGK